MLRRSRADRCNRRTSVRVARSLFAEADFPVLTPMYGEWDDEMMEHVRQYAEWDKDVVADVSAGEVRT
jgi:hypothetical protein